MFDYIVIDVARGLATDQQIYHIVRHEAGASRQYLSKPTPPLAQKL